MSGACNLGFDICGVGWKSKESCTFSNNKISVFVLYNIYALKYFVSPVNFSLSIISIKKNNKPFLTFLLMIFWAECTAVLLGFFGEKNFVFNIFLGLLSF